MTAKRSLWAFPTVREKTVCFLTKILLQARATSMVLLLLSLPCVTVPSEELNEAQVSGRLRDVAVSIPKGGLVSSSASSDGRKGEHCLFNFLFDGLCAHTLGSVVFFPLQVVHYTFAPNTLNPSPGLGVCRSSVACRR